MTAFHVAYERGELVTPPEDYIDLTLIPAVLHIDPLVFDGYPLLLQGRIRSLLMQYIAGGQGLNVSVIRGKV